jgi:2,3-bisphosphoglycerate-independent phosphoglycerate mutase
MSKADNQKKHRPTVVSRHGRYRFQTGMVTASLLARGIEMADAFAISNQLRDEIRSLDEITAEELELRTRALVEKTLGIPADQFPQRQFTLAEAGSTMVRAGDRVYPYSRGIVFQQLTTAGLEYEAAMRLAQEIYLWLISRGGIEIEEAALELEVCGRLEALGDPHALRRFRFVSWVRRTERPLFLLLGGATGTGKSTLATELAVRLGIRTVTSTDMIRETMRTVLSAEVVPGLHDHSFRGMLQGGKVLSKPRERVLAGYRQQCDQVAVGVRAVIRRATRERSHMILEGTHIVPPFHRYLPPGSDAIGAGLVLAVLDEDKHKSRFPRRAKTQTTRNPNTYLEAFQSVRWIHDDLLSAAEDANAVVVASEDLEVTVRGVVDYLSRAIPFEEMDDDVLQIRMPTKPEDKETGPRTLFLILDGMADEPNPALGGLTPLAAADTPTLEALAGRGGQGQVLTTHTPGKAASTNEGLLALLGHPESSKQVGRGLLEALGNGVPLAPGAVLFRGNMATVASDGSLVDRRAGRIRAGVEDLVSTLTNVNLPGGIRGWVYAGHEHRLTVMLQGAKLSAAVGNTDPGGEAFIQRVLEPVALDDTPEAARTVDALKALLAKARDVLEGHPLNQERIGRGLYPANCIITRGTSRVGDMPSPRHSPKHAALISACPTALGVARTVGMEAATSAEMTGNLDTNLAAKFGAAASLFENRNFVAIHFKGTDIAAHDKRPLEKRDFISAIDHALGRFLWKNPTVTEGLRVVVSADHGTSCLTGNHTADPVPLLVANWSEEGEPERFDEESAEGGAIGLIRPGELSALLFPVDGVYTRPMDAENEPAK